MMPKEGIRKLLLTIFVFACTSANASPIDASKLVSAANDVSILGRTINETRKYCSSYYPDQKQLLDYYSLLWTDNNDADIGSTEEIIAGQGKGAFYNAQGPLFSQKLQEIKADRTAENRQTYCSSFLNHLAHRDQDVPKAAPKAHTVLQDYRNQHPVPGDPTTASDSMMGCIKQSFNRGVDLDQAVSTCECMTTAVYKNFTTKELQEYDTAARAGHDVSGATKNTVDLPQYQRIKPTLQQCPAKHLEMPATGILGRPW
jgi:hypothetical protein